MKEKSKGNMLTQTTYQMMEGTNDYNFVGNIESRDIFDTDIDVIVFLVLCYLMNKFLF